jgi:hypothetical protein
VVRDHHRHARGGGLLGILFLFMFVGGGAQLPVEEGGSVTSSMLVVWPSVSPVGWLASSSAGETRPGFVRPESFARKKGERQVVK